VLVTGGADVDGLLVDLAVVGGVVVLDDAGTVVEVDVDVLELVFGVVSAFCAFCGAFVAVFAEVPQAASRSTNGTTAAATNFALTCTESQSLSPIRYGRISSTDPCGSGGPDHSARRSKRARH
jgi:hypothetical protein